MQPRLCRRCGWMLPHGPEVCRYPRGPLPQRGHAEPRPDPEKAFDEGRRAIRAGGELRRCTPIEWALLELFRRRPGAVMTPAHLHTVWDSRADAICDTSLKVYLSRLRRKLRGSGWKIRNDWGHGWTLEREW